MKRVTINTALQRYRSAGVFDIVNEAQIEDVTVEVDDDERETNKCICRLLSKSFIDDTIAVVGLDNSNSTSTFKRVRLLDLSPTSSNSRATEKEEEKERKKRALDSLARKGLV